MLRTMKAKPASTPPPRNGSRPKAAPKAGAKVSAAKDGDTDNAKTTPKRKAAPKKGSGKKARRS